MKEHQPYELINHRKADFRVKYRIYSYEEGGRYSPANQGYRCDFEYKNDGKYKHSIYMIWPEFEDEQGEVILDKSLPIPLTGTARMWIINKDFIEYHRQYIHPGMTGYFVEGQRKVAECEVIELINLAEIPAEITISKKAKRNRRG